MKNTFYKFFVGLSYFLITIVILSSIGVWIPFANDKAQYDHIKQETWVDLSWNLVTYSIAIVMVAFIDRLLHLFKTSNEYKRNELEFLMMVLVLIVGIGLVYKSLVDSKFQRINESIFYSSAFTVLAWAVWIYVKIKTPSIDNFSSLGGRFH